MGPPARRLAEIREKIAAMGVEVEDDSEPIAAETVTSDLGETIL